MHLDMGLIYNEHYGAAGGTRTPDPLITNAVVYHILRDYICIVV